MLLEEKVSTNIMDDKSTKPEPVAGMPVTVDPNADIWFVNNYANIIGNGTIVDVPTLVGVDRETGEKIWRVTLKKNGDLIPKPVGCGEGPLIVHWNYLKPVT